MNPTIGDIILEQVLLQANEQLERLVKLLAINLLNEGGFEPGYAGVCFVIRDTLTGEDLDKVKIRRVEAAWEIEVTVPVEGDDADL